MTVELVEIVPLDRRRCCECCGFPTLGAPDQYQPDPEWEHTRTSCDLCEWDNRPLDRNGDVRAGASADEERNDGLGLEAARTNFARFLSIYDPNDPPFWRVAPPTTEVIEAREALRTAYGEFLPLALPSRWEKWRDLCRHENALYAALSAQRARDEGASDSETEEN